MELLANYSDEDSARDTPTLERQHDVPPAMTPDPPAAGLQAEWESFEKMIGGSAPPFTSAPLPVAAPELPTLQGKSCLSILSEPPTLTDYHDHPLFVDSSVSTGPPTLTNVSDLSKFDSSCEQSNGPSVHLTGLSTEYNPEIVDESSDDDEMPILTKVTESPHSSPEHSSDMSTSSGSRSSSVDSVKSFEKEKEMSSSTQASSKKSSSPSKEASSSHRKDIRRDKRSRSRSPHHRRRRSSDRKRSRSRTRKSSDRKHRSRSHGKSEHHSSSHSRRHGQRSGSCSRRRASRERRLSKDHHRRREHGSHRRDHSRDRRHRSRSHSRDRRSRSGSRDRNSRVPGSHGHGRGNRMVGPKKKIVTFKEKMRQQLMKASKLLADQADGSESTAIELPNDRSSNIPLSAANVFQAISMAGNITPQMALLQTMAAMHQKAQEMTGVAVPKFYNPAAVNPLKYAEQVQKRKLLWSKNKETKEQEEVPGGHNQWQSTAFVQDQDGKMAAKFRKLMGMKEGEEDGEQGEDEEKARESEEKKKQTEELFYRLDKEYEFARMTTHTHRGIGLGFQSQGFPNP